MEETTDYAAIQVALQVLANTDNSDSSLFEVRTAAAKLLEDYFNTTVQPTRIIPTAQ